ncbi:MAG: hypothetical protein MUF21_12895 [Gemmatimonadaceae bacterium]|nr:hypothetical protein [Gemmatimonadaceae bacterium]
MPLVARVGLLACLVLPPAAAAQRPTDSLERRFHFAELFTGIDVTALQPASSPDGRLQVPGRALPRVTVGGLHFWGHADFAVTFALGRPARGEGASRSRLGTGIETRARWYLRPMRTDGVSPFLGAGLGATDLEIGDGPRIYRMQPMGQAGLVWRRGGTLVEAGWSTRARPLDRYPRSRSDLAALDVGEHTVFVGVHRLFETTAGLVAPIRSGAWGDRERALREAGRLSGPTLAVGLSSPILTGSTARNRELRPFLAERPRGRPNLDLGIGWHADGPDVQVNLALRRMQFATDAFGFDQRSDRTSLALEAFTFLGDWHGFAPFVGPVVSVERLRLRERDGGTPVTDVARDLVAPGVLVGWDIRPTRSQPWVLRTNLRWFPTLDIPLSDRRHALGQLEFNFIQLVWYPRR